MCDGEQGWWWVWWLTFHGEWAHQDGGAGTYLTMKSECAPCMICFSERMCSCCLVSTMWRFLRIFMAKVLDSSLFNWTLKKSTENKWEKGHSVNITECLLIPKLPSAWSTAGTPPDAAWVTQYVLAGAGQKSRSTTLVHCPSTGPERV